MRYFAVSLNSAMFEFGLFSTHIPYIITVVAYLLSYGFYALNKPNADAAELATTSISPSHEIRLASATSHQTYDATSHFQAQQVDQREQASQPPVADAIRTTICSHPSTTLSTYYKVSIRFSRPPTFC